MSEETKETTAGNMYGVSNNPPSENKSSLPKRRNVNEQIGKYQTIEIDGVKYELVDRQHFEATIADVEKLRRELKTANTRLGQLTNTVKSLRTDIVDAQRALKKVTRFE